MIWELLLTGWLIGFSIAMPLGAIGTLCLRYALLHGMRYGLISGLGVALADAACALIAGYSITTISEWLNAYSLIVHVIGVSFLWYIGVRLLLSKPIDPTTIHNQQSKRYVVWEMFYLTFFNPLTILTFIGIYGGFNLIATQSSPLLTFLLATGVFVGSMTWWLVLSYGVSSFRKKLTMRSFKIINQIAGCLILLFAVFATLSLFTSI